MTISRAGFLLFCLLLLSAVATSADDLGMINIKNHHQAELATAIVGTAYTRVDNRFLVSFDSDQLERLQVAGVLVEYISSTEDMTSLALVRQHDRSTQTQDAYQSLGPTIDIGAGMSLVPTDPARARSLSESTRLSLTPLNQLAVPIKFVPSAVYTLAALADDYPTDTLVDLISLDSLYAFDTRLEDFETRYIWTDSIDAARDWIVQKFQDWGYTNVTTPQFYWYDWHYNVMCIKQGYAEPDKVIVIGGHYDSITYGQPTDPETYAPGADDNASGTALTMEVARVLAGVPCRKTIIFMAFSAEEVGLVGSRAAAQQFASSGTDIEVMFNYDMVAYVEQAHWPLDMSSGSVDAYKWLSIDAANRLTSLTPVSTSMGSSSDHYGFVEQGFNVCNNIEGNFNYDGWHTNLDLSSRLNFDFYTDVARTALASIAIVANSASPLDDLNVMDMGDGNALQVSWEPCYPDYATLVMYGTESGIYTDTVEVVGQPCSALLDGLTDSQPYFISAVGIVVGGYPAAYAVEVTGTPYQVPRPPGQLQAEPDLFGVGLDWADAIEVDFDHFRLYRQVEDFQPVLLVDNLTVSEYADYDVVGMVNYTYMVTTVDADGYESALSGGATAVAATFDQGILICDEWSSGSGSPGQAGQEEFWDSAFAPIGYTIVNVENQSSPLSRNAAAPYSSLYWIDDDIGSRNIIYSADTLRWYGGFTNNIFVAGFRTIQYWDGPNLTAGDILYDEFYMSHWVDHESFDWTGATGSAGWPDVQVGPTCPFGNAPNIPTVTVRPGGTAIYLFDSNSDDPTAEGLPCAVAYDGPHGKRVVLGFPLYWLTPASAEALVAHANAWFGETAGSQSEHGDVDGSGSLDISDLVYLVAYAFQGGPPPPSLDAADLDGSCQIDISDVVYLVEYFFLGGSEPQAGCVE